jgi:hypothetical protein
MVHFGEFFVAFPFGIIWCFPLAGFAFFAGRGARWALVLKLAGIILLAGFLSLFVGWHGGGAVAGPRFIVPFLMLLFPEVAAGLAALLRRWHWVGYTVPLLTVLFLPSLDYHNGLVYRWADGADGYQKWGESDPLMQPGLLAWRVILAKASGEQTFRPSDKMDISSPTGAIFPMTGVSRLSYALATPGSDPRQMAVRNWLMDHGLAYPLIWVLLRAVLAAALLLWLLFAAAAVSRRPQQARRAG